MGDDPTASAVDVIARAIREAPRVYVEKHGHFKWRVVAQGIGLHSIYEGSVDAADEAADRLREELRATTVLTALTAAGFVVTRDGEKDAPVLRWTYAEGRTLDEMRANLRATELHADGDVRLIWANEGDLWHLRPLPAPPAPEPTDAPTKRRDA